jgi:hypothetical protein
VIVRFHLDDEAITLQTNPSMRCRSLTTTKHALIQPPSRWLACGVIKECIIAKSLSETHSNSANVKFPGLVGRSPPARHPGAAKIWLIPGQINFHFTMLRITERRIHGSKCRAAEDEIFIRMAKAGSTIAGLMECFGTVVSVSLQHGVPLKVLCDKLSHTRFEPSGWTGNAEIGYAKSIMDYLFRWMELRFLSGKQLPLFGPGGSRESAGGEPNPDAVDGSQFLHDISDSPHCVACGGLVKPSGTCYTCINCGQTSGCS